jgi:Zn-dependent protease/predicted transcriptional regulator
MNGGFRLGSLLGFEIRIDYSWFVIFFLLLWTLAFGLFPEEIPGLTRAQYLGMGLSATLLFFASLVGHELAHSLVARQKGIPIGGITLFIFGGMAHARMEFEKPGDEFQVAVAGPIASFLFGFLFAAVAWAAAAQGWGIETLAIARYLAFINVALAVFNLLPGFPLDGGRILRSAAWKITGDMRRATRLATRGGKLVAYLLIALGLLQLFAGAVVGGLWLLLIGWFIRTAAEASYAQFRLAELLGDVTAEEAMTPAPESADPDVSLTDFVERYFFQGRHQGYPVVADGRPLGIVTLSAVRAVPREKWPTLRVRDVMAPADAEMLVDPALPMLEVLERLSGSGSHRVLVERNGILLGIITRSDVARWLERIRALEGR